MNNQLHDYYQVERILNQVLENQRKNIKLVMKGEYQYTRKDLIEWYTLVYNCALESESNGKQLKEFFKKQLAKVLKNSEKEKMESFILKKFIKEKEIYNYHSKICYKVFQYLDKSLLMTREQKLQETIISIFNSQYVDKYINKIQESFIILLNENCRHEQDIQNCLKKVFEMLKECDEAPPKKEKYLSEIKNSLKRDKFKPYYKQTYIQLEQSNSNHDIIIKINQMYQEEQKFISYIFACDQSFCQKLIKKFKKHIIKQFNCKFTANTESLQYIFEQQKFDVLSILINLFVDQDPTLDKFKKCYFNFIKLKAESIIKSLINIQFESHQKKCEQIIQCIQDLTNSYIENMQIIENYASKNLILISQLNSAVGAAIQLDEDEVEKGFQLYIKKLLVQQLSDNKQREKNIKDAIYLFRCFPNKDQFLKNYEFQLCERLIMITQKGKMESEKIVTGFLKEMCGSDYTKSLEFMIQDYSSQLDREEDYNFNGKVIILPRILNRQFWPLIESQMEVKINYPQLGQLKEQILQQFHSKDNQKIQKNIEFFDYISYIQISYRSDKPYLISMSLVGAAILYCFQYSNEPLRDYDILHQINVPKNILEQYLKQLENNMLLLKNENGNYQFNEQFYNKKSKIDLKIYFTTKSIKKEENFEELEKSRADIIKAAIVKIMKTRKTQLYQDLVSEVKNIVTVFKTTDQMIKQAIDDLLSLDYLQRNNTNIKELNYVG